MKIIKAIKILEETSDEIKNLMEHTQGCSDGNCYVRRIENNGEIPKGQHTNSSCQCHRRQPDAEHIGYSAVKMSKAIHEALEILKDV